MVRLNLVRSCYQKTSAAVLELITPAANYPTTTSESLEATPGGGDATPGRSVLRRQRYQFSGSNASPQVRLLGGGAGSHYYGNDGTPRAISCLIRVLPYFICFCLGAFISGTVLIGFDQVTPCGSTLSETLQNYLANASNRRWNTSATKYEVECPRFPPTLLGKLPYPLNGSPTWQELDTLYGPSFTKDSAIGGHFKPDWCQAVSRVAVIVPYRDRDENLRDFLFYMHKIMQRQLLDYAIFVVEQAGPASTRFNRGVLLNVGFAEAMKAYDFDCVLFYDVDKIPVDDRCSHACPKPGYVRHMAAYQDRFEKMPFRDEYFGGVLAMNSEDVRSLNGFSNIFFGYGYEDDEFLQRIKIRNLTIYREHELLTHYRNLGHAGDWTGFDWKHENKNLLYTTDERINFDGLSTVTYKSITVLKLPVYTRIIVDISENAILQKLRNDNEAFYKIISQALSINPESTF